MAGSSTFDELWQKHMSGRKSSDGTTVPAAPRPPVSPPPVSRQESSLVAEPVQNPVFVPPSEPEEPVSTEQSPRIILPEPRREPVKQGPDVLASFDGDLPDDFIQSMMVNDFEEVDDDDSDESDGLSDEADDGEGPPADERVVQELSMNLGSEFISEFFGGPDVQDFDDPDGSDDLDDGEDSDDDGGGEDEPEPVQSQQVQNRPAPRGRPPSKNTKTSELRGFPTSLVQMAKLAFPDASNVRAVAAFMYANRDPDAMIDYSDIPDDVIEMAEKLDRTKTLRKVDDNVGRIMKKLRGIEKQGRLERFVLTTLLMNANGLLGAHVSSGSGINYTPPDFDLVFRELAAAADKYWAMIDRQDGRPIR